jgi:hypothetical protein
METDQTVLLLVVVAVVSSAEPSRTLGVEAGVFAVSDSHLKSKRRDDDEIDTRAIAPVTCDLADL